MSDVLGGFGGPFDAPPAVPRRGAPGLSAGGDGFTPLRGRNVRGALPRRRRKSSVAGLLAGAALRAVLLVALPVALALWIVESPYFRIHEVKVEGGARVSADWVRGELAPLVGRHVLAVSLEGVRERLSTHPWVASVELRRELPDRLRVAVVERVPVALLAVGDRRVFLDRDGRPIADCAGDATRADGGQRLLVLRDRFVTAHDADAQEPATAAVEAPVPVTAALALVDELRRAQAAWGAGTTEVEILGEGDYRVQTGALPYPLLLRSGSVAEAVRNLERALPEISRRLPAVEEIDLRQPRRLVVRAGAHPSATVAHAATAPVTHSIALRSATTTR